MQTDQPVVLASACRLILARGEQSWQVTTMSIKDWSSPLAHWHALPQTDNNEDYIFASDSGGVLYSDSEGSVTIWLENYEALMPYVVWSSASVSAHVQNATWYDWLFDPITTHDLSAGVPGWLALRPRFDTDRNLNVLGNGPYEPGNAVAAWRGWDGGMWNEVWQMVSLDTLREKSQAGDI